MVRPYLVICLVMLIGVGCAPMQKIKDKAMGGCQPVAKRIPDGDNFREESACVKIKKSDSPFELQKDAAQQKIDELYERGYKYAINGQWGDALEQWSAIVSLDGGRSVAVYDMGLAYEVTGALINAEEQYKRAINLKTDDDYFEALSRVRADISADPVLCKQFNRECRQKAAAPATKSPRDTNRQKSRNEKRKGKTDTQNELP